jgi:hypothetical protein
MKADSSRMKTIAYIGILFLPTALVASIFDAVYDGNSSPGAVVLRLFVLLLIAAFLTAVAIATYTAYTNLIKDGDLHGGTGANGSENESALAWRRRFGWARGCC